MPTSDPANVLHQSLSAHCIFGAMLTAAFLLAPLLGLGAYEAHAAAARHEHAWRVAHRWAGQLLVAATFVNACLGMRLAGWASATLTAYVVVGAVVCGPAVVGPFVRRRVGGRGLFG